MSPLSAGLKAQRLRLTARAICLLNVGFLRRCLGGVHVPTA